MTSHLDAETMMKMAIEKAKKPTFQELLDDDTFYSDPENYPYPLTPERKRWLVEANAKAAEIRENVIASTGDETRISTLVRQYLLEHPDYLFPRSGDTHPSVLIFSEQIHQWMVQKMGGIYPFEEELLRAATFWFADEKLERECRIFDHLFGSSLLVSTAHGDPRYDRLCQLYNQWREICCKKKPDSHA